MPSADINPIIPGFAPDPSIIRIDDDFFLVNSTFHLFPGLPIYTSKDLLSWKQIGNGINRRNQLSLVQSDTRLTPKDEKGDRMLITGGLYAPTIRHHNGIIYIVCTNMVHQDPPAASKSENFIISTPDIWSDKWSDPVYFDFKGFDPSILFDDDGKVYMHGSSTPGPWTKIHLFEVDLQTGEKLSGEKEIWRGTGGVWPEGPHLYKKDSWYYLMISEGGTHEGHMITVARSNNIWGPYKSFDQNPILTARGTNEYIRYTGHGDLIQDQQGQWWGVCLGVRVDDGRYIMGRESFLTAAEWSEGEWPKLSQAKRIPVLMNGKQLVRSNDNAPLTTAPIVDYVYIRDAKLEDHNISSNGKTIVLTASKGDMSQWKDPVTFVGKRHRRLEGTSSVVMHRPDMSTSSTAKAGLAYYKDEHRYIKLFYDSSLSSIVLEIVNNARDISRTSKRDVQLLDTVAFRLEYTERSLKFSYGIGKDIMDWIAFDVIDTLDMTGPDFVGPVIGIFALADVGDVKVQFDDLKVD